MAAEARVTIDDRWFAGEHKVLRFFVTQDDGKTKQDITGWQLQYDFRDDPDDSKAIFSKSSSGIALVDPDGAGFPHAVDVTVQAADTKFCSQRAYWHALWRTDDPAQSVLAFGPVALRVAGRIV